MIWDLNLRKVNHNKSIESHVNFRYVGGKGLTAFVRLMTFGRLHYFLAMLDMARQVDVGLHTCDVD